MKNVLLITEPETLRIQPVGPVTANIWLEISGQQFPMLAWNDFAVVILGWWTVSLSRLLRGVSAREVVNFMDGPYAVEIGLSQPGMLHFRALKRGMARTEEVATGEEPARPFILELITQSGKILDACKRHDSWSKDADVLESSVEGLKQDSKRLLE